MTNRIPQHLVTDFFNLAHLLRRRPAAHLSYRDALRYLRQRRVEEADLSNLRELPLLVLRLIGQAPLWAERIAVWAAVQCPRPGPRPRPNDVAKGA
jgi:hypothetical protein